jgi:hypothetical protein
MQTERICFRLMLLVAAIFLIAFGALALHATVRGKSMHAEAIAWGKRWSEVAAPCQNWQDRADGSPQPAMCSDRTYIKTMLQDAELYATESSNYFHRSRVFSKAAVAVPLCSILLFYSIRLVLTGRIRPPLDKGGP